MLIHVSSYAVNKVVTTINVGDTPAGIAITPDGKYAYVANNNNDGIVGGDTVSVINVATSTVIATVSDPSFNQAYTITINEMGTRAYVTNSNSSTITIIAIPSNVVIGTIAGFDGPSGMVISPNGYIAYVNNYGGPIAGSGFGTTVSVVNLNSNMIVGTITVGQAPAAMAISKDGSFVYTINYVDGNPGTGTMSVIRTSDATVVRTISGFSGPFGVSITPNGKEAFVANFGSNNFSPFGTTVSVVNLANFTVTATIQLGTQPSGIAITPNGRIAYASNYNTLYLGPNFTQLTPGQGTVNLIDVCTNKVICPAIVVGASPANIAITPDGRRAYVSNYSANTVSVINICDAMWLNVCCN